MFFNKLVAMLYWPVVRQTSGVVNYPKRIQYPVLEEVFKDNATASAFLQDPQNNWDDICPILDVLLDTYDIYSPQGWWRIAKSYTKDGCSSITIHSCRVPYSFDTSAAGSRYGMREFYSLIMSQPSELPDMQRDIAYWKAAPKKK